MLLQAAGHQVVTPAEAGTSGLPDDIHFAYAAAQGLILLTKNPDDFAELHAAEPTHAGIVAVYQDNDPRRDRTYGDIVRALTNMEKAGIELKNAFHVLNAWRYKPG